MGDQLFTLDPDTGAVLNQVPVSGGDIVGLGVASTLPPQQSTEADVIVNGSFETGDFTGWTTATTGTPFVDWTVSGAGQGPGFGFATTAPQDGTFVAWNGFDGGGPMEFTMYQDVVVPAAGQLAWQYRAQWDFTLGNSELTGRDLVVEVLDPSDNSLLATLHTFSTGDQATNPTGDSGWLSETADVSAFAGQNVRVMFREVIPGSSTGPGQIEFDAISLDSVGVTTPDVDEYTIDLTGHAGKQVDIVLAGQDGADFDSVSLELIAPDGSTVLASGTTDTTNSGTDAENYNQGIVDFTVPAGGVYTVRISSLVAGEYGLMVTTSRTFDTEPNDNPLSDPLRTLSANRSSLGYLEAGESDFYEIDLVDGEPLMIFTGTPNSESAATITNNLNPELIVRNELGVIVAQDQDSVGDGNAIVSFVTGSPGTYTVEVAAESDFGEYTIDVAYNASLDYGDAPISFPTLIAADGARHIDTGPRLGNLRDGETDGQPTATADGDDNASQPDEDGVLFGIIGADAQVAAVNIDLQNATTAKVDAWVDFNHNGVWEPAEQILTAVDVVGGLQTINYSVPAGVTVGDAIARVRLSTAGGLQPTGFAVDGEVEDDVVNIVSETPQVESVLINGGEQTRSAVTSLLVTFDTTVDHASLNSAFVVTNVTSSIPVGLVSVTPLDVNGKTEALLEFSGDSTVAPSLPTLPVTLDDGNYRLDVIAGQVIDTITGHPMTANYQFGGQDRDAPNNDDFFRWYGDANGDGNTDFLDFSGGFLPAFGNGVGSADYRFDLDYDGEGNVDFLDFSNGFLPHFGTGRP